MAEGGRHPHQESCAHSSGHGSIDENSTHLKLMSFGVQQAPSMDIDGIDLTKGRFRTEMARISANSQPNQANSCLALAERQEPYRTIQSECPNFDSLPIAGDISRIPTEQQSHPSEIRNFEPLHANHEIQSHSIARENPQAQLITSVTGAPNHGLNIIASIENNEATNIPVRTTSARHISPLQSSSDNADVGNNVSSSSGRNVNSQDSNDSRAARSVNYRRQIDDNTLVHELPYPLINFLSATFDRQDCKNWKDLVNLYNWNFKQITLFKNKNHPDGIFCSLLNENEFQQYNVLQLKEDLLEIPRKDALEDLKKMIDNHNSEL